MARLFCDKFCDKQNLSHTIKLPYFTNARLGIIINTSEQAMEIPERNKRKGAKTMREMKMMMKENKMMCMMCCLCMMEWKVHMR